MNFILLLLVVLCHSRLVAQTPPPLPQLATGANENVFATVQETYYVAPDGNDINPGTLSLPFKTFSKGVNKAVERKNAGISVKIILRNGTYREKKVIAASANAPNNACIIIEAENTGQAIISGSEDWTGEWTQVGSNWTHAWIFNWGVAPSYSQVKNELGRRREMFFVNKVLYTQVLSQTNLTDGTYYVDEIGDKAYIRPLPGVNMATALIEVGILEKVFTINANQKNIAIKGLVFQHDASFPVGAGGGEGVFRVGKDCSNILLQDLSIEWNNGAGLGALDASDFRQNFTFRRVKINNNGGGGFSFGNSQNLLFEDCETSYNRFRGKWAGQAIGASPGGFKLASTHRTSFIRHKAIGNYGRGMWWDIANRDMTAKDCYVDGNYGSGIFVEYDFGPALIENCTIINTKRSDDYTLRNQGGLQFASTANLTIRNCTIKNNIQGQIKCWDQQRTMTDHLTGEVKRYDSTNVGNIYLRNNEVACLDSSQSLIDLPDWGYLKNTFNSDSNTYQHPAREDAFRVYQGGTGDGDNASDANYFIATYYTFAEWKQYIDGDVNSTFGEVSGPEEIPVVLPDSIGAYIDESNIQAHYYVSPTGLNTNTGTSPEEALANPFVAIERANANSLASGLVTKIHIANGTYIIPRKEYDYRSDAMDPDSKSSTLIIEGETYGGVILDGNNTGRLNLKGKSNLVMRNLVFTNCGGEAAFKAEEFYGNGVAVPQPQSSNWRIEYCAFNNNKQRGLRILHVDHLTMEHCEIKDNLDDGFQYIGRESHLNDILVSGNDKPEANQKDFGNGGFNFASKRSLVENMTVRDNRGAGFRGDFQNEDVIVRNCIFEDNTGGGVTVEVTFGPILFLKCSIERNNFGVKISAAHNVTIDSCRINDNRDSQIDMESQFRDKSGDCGISGPPSDLDLLTWHCNPNKTLDGIVKTTIRNSFISTNRGETSALFHYGTFDNQPDKTWYDNWYKDEFVGDNNVYFKSDTTAAFVTDYWTNNTESSLVKRMSTLSEWKYLTGSDKNSRWATDKPAGITITNTTLQSPITICDSIKVKAEVYFPDPIKQVSFYANGQLLASDTSGSDGYGFSGKFDAGTQILTAIATDIFDNTATSTALVINIQPDSQAPIVLTRNATINLANGQASITASAIDSGSTDACGIASMILDKTSFDCSSVGSQTVTLTVTDVNGNAASAMATVTVVGEVQSAPSIAVTRTDNTTTGTVIEQTIALGYGAQSLTLTASVSGSADGKTYSWSPASGLSSVSGPGTVFTPTAAGSYPFTVTATNAYGCQASATVTIKVIEARCGIKNDKVKVCHKGKELCISPNAVQAHLGHGDKIGSCESSSPATTLMKLKAGEKEKLGGELSLQAFPNPALTKTTIRYGLPEASMVLLEIYDLAGKKVSTLVNGKQQAGIQQISYNSSLLAKGIYLVKLVAGNQYYTLKLIVAK